MHAISSYRGYRPTKPQTHNTRRLQTGPITIHCAAKRTAGSVITVFYTAANGGIGSKAGQFKERQNGGGGGWRAMLAYGAGAQPDTDKRAPTILVM